LRRVEENWPVSIHFPSSRRQASHSTVSGSTLTERRNASTESPSVRAPPAEPASPVLRRTDERWARSAMCWRSAITGAANAMILSTLVLAASATASGVSPARMRAWMSRGRRALSICVSNRR
jgi:hypothetical protein